MANPRNRTRVPAKSHANDDNFLTVDDIVSGGEEPYTRLELPEVKKGGKPGVVFLRALPAGDVIDKAERVKGDPSSVGAKDMYDLISQAVVDQNGKRLFDGPEGVEKLRKSSIKVYTRLLQGVNGMMGDVFGIVPKAVMDKVMDDLSASRSNSDTGSDSPTASPAGSESGTSEAG